MRQVPLFVLGFIFPCDGAHRLCQMSPTEKGLRDPYKVTAQTAGPRIFCVSTTIALCPIINSLMPFERTGRTMQS